jgi:tol-pal system protein YbgF
MHAMRRTTLAALILAASFTLPAHAVSKEMIQLQTQIQQLQDAVARLQQSNDERMGVLKDLVQQTADSVNKMSVTVGTLQQHMTTQGEASAAKTDQMSGQIQSLNDSLDELKARMAKLERSLGTIESQQQSANAILQNMPAATNTSAPPTIPAGPDLGPAPVRDTGRGPAPVTRAPAAATGPAVGDLYRAAYGDYMAGKYPLAASEFTDIANNYPDDNLAGNAFFYLGEIDTRSGKPTAAIENYDHLLERYPDNQKIPAAHLHKGEAMLALKQTDAGARELRALIQRFPNSPEAAQARTRLNAAGVRIAPRTK